MADPLHLLLIEDSEDDAFLILRELRQGGYEPSSTRVDTSAALGEALQAPRAWDLITCDYVMPRFTAEGAISQIRSAGIDTPVIVVSGGVAEEVAIDCLRLGAQDFVSKQRLTRLVPAVRRELSDAEQRRARRRAEDMAYFQARLLDEVGEAVIATDPSGKILYWNRAAERLYGWKATEVLGCDIVQVVPSEPSRGAAAEIMEHLRRGERWTGEHQVRRRDGSVFVARVTDAPVFDGDGALVAVIGISYDVSDYPRGMR